MMRFLFATLLISVMSLLWFLPAISHAQGGCTLEDFDSGINCVKELRTESGIDEELSLTQFILGLIRILLAVAAVLAVGFIVIGGVLYITSAGDEQKSARAKQTIIYAVLGLLIIGAAILIVNFVISAFAGGGG